MKNKITRKENYAWRINYLIIFNFDKKIFMLFVLDDSKLIGTNIYCHE